MKSALLCPVAQKQHLTNYRKAVLILFLFSVEVLQHSFADIVVDLIFYLESNFDPDLMH